MNITYTAQDLIDFEEDIADCFNRGMIRAPVHLYSNNEEQIIEIFKEHVNEDDYVLCTWRSHYQCLLKGVPKDVLKNDILEGKSISLCYPEHNIYSSAIVGGNIPIATGIAMGIKLNGKKNKVVCFIGDMTATLGVFYENMKYAQAQDLPILWIIENNGKSVCTHTYDTWGFDENGFTKSEDSRTIFYFYKSKYPHAGAGRRITF